MNLLRRGIMQKVDSTLNWILQKVAGSTGGIVISPIDWLSSGDVGALMEFDIKLNPESFSSSMSIIGSVTNQGIFLDGADEIRLRTTTFNFPTLDLFDGGFHHFKIEKITTTTTRITVDDLTPVTQAVALDIQMDTLAGSVTFLPTFDGTMKKFKFVTSGGTTTHDLAINDGAGATSILNRGTTSDGVIEGIEDTDYVWE
jgi:hypothetical protein